MKLAKLQWALGLAALGGILIATPHLYWILFHGELHNSIAILWCWPLFFGLIWFAFSLIMAGILWTGFRRVSRPVGYGFLLSVLWLVVVCIYCYFNPSRSPGP